MTINVLLLL